MADAISLVGLVQEMGGDVGALVSFFSLNIKKGSS
jgi:hypothetical protein